MQSVLPAVTIRPQSPADRQTERCFQATQHCKLQLHAALLFMYLFIYLFIQQFLQLTYVKPIWCHIQVRSEISVQALVGETRLQKSFSGNENKKMILKTKPDVYIFVCFVFWTYFVRAVVSEWLSSEQVVCWLAGGFTSSLNAKAFGHHIIIRQKAPTQRIKGLHGRVVLQRFEWLQ